MTSILTNNSAMTALQTLKNINMNLNKTQTEISTGKTIASAKDNSAVWAISKVMESDVAGFDAISDSLALGGSTITTARVASESVQDLLKEMKKKIVAASGENVDRVKLQTEVESLRDQITTVVGGAQFNGLNLVDGTQTSVDVLASLDRSGTAVTSSSITVNAQNLSAGGYTAKVAFAAAGTGTISAAGDTVVLSLDAAGGTDTLDISPGTTTAWAAGDSVTLRIGDKAATYTVSASDIATGNTPEDMIAVGLKNAIDALGIADLTVNFDSANPGQLAFDNQGTTDLTVTGQFKNANSGGLGALATIDVSTATGATAALGSIETMIQTSIDAAAAFGAVETRIEIQSDFVGKLTDALKSGIGSLVDADMEETSARLQALQVQQQLGIQALSIANQQPQNVLSLFR